MWPLASDPWPLCIMNSGSWIMIFFLHSAVAPNMTLRYTWDNFKNRLFLERKGCLAPKRHSSAYPSIRAFSTSLAAEEVLRDIPAQIAISARSAPPRAARLVKEMALNLKTSFPYKSKLSSMRRWILKNNSQSKNPVDSSEQLAVNGASCYSLYVIRKISA